MFLPNQTLNPRHLKRTFVDVHNFLTKSSSPCFAIRLDQPNEHYEACERYVCNEQWSSVHAQRLYTLALLILQYALPLAVLLFTYSRIAAEVWGTQPPGEAHNVRDMRMAKNKRKVCSHVPKSSLAQFRRTPLNSTLSFSFYAYCSFEVDICWCALSTFHSPHFSAQFCIHRQTASADKNRQIFN